MEDNKIPDAWDLISKAPNSGYSEREFCIDWDNIQDLMIEFAKMHVEAALKEASIKAECCEDAIVDLDHTIIEAYVEKDSILNAYPLDLIK